MGNLYVFYLRLSHYNSHAKQGINSMFIFECNYTFCTHTLSKKHENLVQLVAEFYFLFLQPRLLES